MEMFLVLLAMSAVCTVVSATLFAAAVRHGEADAAKAAPVRPALRKETSFFIEDAPASVPGRIPTEVLVLQIERHVRLEQAAGEAFVHAPTVGALHRPTPTSLIN
jgi:hypothetical protein